MIKIWAAVDILHGKTVTLNRGNPSFITDWKIKPDEAIALWQREGVDGIHLVDLDRALGIGSNEQIIEGILKKSRVPVQVAGGIRSVDDAIRILSFGANRVVVSTIVLSRGSKAEELLSKVNASNVAVAIDFKRGYVFTHGWQKNSKLHLSEALSIVEKLGFDTIIATNIERDGTATGPDLSAYKEIKESTSLRIIGSGGITSKDDILKLQEIGLDGVIIGRALYEGRIKIGKIR